VCSKLIKSLAFASLLSSGTVRSQGIIYTVPQQPIYYSLFYPGTLDFAIDIDGDGTTDFILRSNDSGSSINNAFLIPQGGNTIVNMNSYVAALNSAEVIGSSLDPVYQWSNAKTPISAAAILLDPTPVEEGNFVGKSSAHIGFDLVRNGANYYGWMYLSSPNNDAAIYANLVSWAYETSPDTPIAAGAVPEPSAIMLLLVSGGAFYLFRRR
jgi:PEP-CTERM motif